MKRKSFKVPYRPIPDINVTSLVDVTLVLLIVFMVAAPIMKSSMDIAVPQAVTAQPTDKEGITIIIQKSGKILIDETSVDESSFDVSFAQIYSSNSGQPVFLKADADVPYSKVLTVVDALRQNGVAELGLVAEPKQSPHARRR
ncbi:biopolymer transporter ExbD [candidate division KSB1 bacterium]|nr:MAG: biopolymer transporter ExbD [candidate division KSB1 bacterium]